MHVSLEYSRKGNIVERRGAPTHPASAGQAIDFGSVFLDEIMFQSHAKLDRKVHYLELGMQTWVQIQT